MRDIRAIIREQSAGAFARAEGPHLYDREGHRWLDLAGASGAHFLGRNHPGVGAALAEVLALDLPNLCAGEGSLLGRALAAELLALAAAPLAEVVFTSSGSEAVEAALRLARLATRRRRFLYLEGGYHGRTAAALSVSGVPALREGMEPLLPTCTPLRVGDWTALERELGRGDVAGLVYEAVQGMTCEVVPPAWLREAERACRQHGALLIADEVLTGLGRTGSWFAYQEVGVRPDLVVVGHGLSGAQVPVGAALCTAEVSRRAAERAGPGPTSTFAENNLAMAAGLAAIAALQDLDAPRRATELSEAFRAGLRDIARRWDCIDRISGRGLVIGVHFRASAAQRLRLQQTLMKLVDGGTFATAVHADLHRRGRIVAHLPGAGADALMMLPPLVCERSDVDWFLDALDDTLASFYGYGGPVVTLGRAVAREAVRTVRRPWDALAGGGA